MLKQSQLLNVINFVATGTAPTVAPAAATGSTTYTYKIVNIDANGGHSIASTAGSDTGGPSALTGVNYEIVTLTRAVGAVSYDVYRTAGGATQGKIGNIVDPGTGTTFAFNDTGLTGDASTAPVANTSGVGLSKDVSMYNPFSVAFSDNGGGKAWKIQGSFDAFLAAEISAVDSASQWFDLASGSGDAITSFNSHESMKIRFCMTSAETSAHTLYCKVSGLASH